MKGVIYMLNEANNHPEITPLTMAIIPQLNQQGEYQSLVLEESNEYVVDYLPSQIVDMACRYFGATLQSRIDGTRIVSDFTHKPPIVIEPSCGLFYLPTTSPFNKDCAWLSHSHVEKIIAKENNCSEVLFVNGRKVFFDISFGSMTNQLNRTAQFRFILENRMKVNYNNSYVYSNPNKPDPNKE